MRMCQNAYPLFFMTKPRLSQAEALLLPKDFVSLNISKVIWQRYIFVLTIEDVSKCIPSFFYDKAPTFPSRGFVIT